LIGLIVDKSANKEPDYFSVARKAYEKRLADIEAGYQAVEKKLGEGEKADEGDLSRDKQT
jgi:hypothetical protein